MMKLRFSVNSMVLIPDPAALGLLALGVIPLVNDLSIRNADHATRKLGVEPNKFRVDPKVGRDTTAGADPS